MILIASIIVVIGIYDLIRATIYKEPHIIVIPMIVMMMLMVIATSSHPRHHHHHHPHHYHHHYHHHHHHHHDHSSSLSWHGQSLWFVWALVLRPPSSVKFEQPAWVPGNIHHHWKPGPCMTSIERASALPVPGPRDVTGILGQQRVSHMSTMEEDG